MPVSSSGFGKRPRCKRPSPDQVGRTRAPTEVKPEENKSLSLLWEYVLCERPFCCGVGSHQAWKYWTGVPSPNLSGSFLVK